MYFAELKKAIEILKRMCYNNCRLLKSKKRFQRADFIGFETRIF